MGLTVATGAGPGERTDTLRPADLSRIAHARLGPVCGTACG